MRLTGDIFGIISWRRLWESCSIAIIPLPGQMATTNDIQEEEPPMTALEKQVKTLAAAVERLTKQNHDLEEQLRQKNAAPGNQGADQEGTSAD